MYFISIANSWSDFIPATVSIRINQEKTIYKVPNNVPTKFQYASDRELVKFLVFQIPSTWSLRAQVEITVEALTEHLYPSLYVKKLEFNERPQTFDQLDYPSI